MARQSFGSETVTSTETTIFNYKTTPRAEEALVFVSNTGSAALTDFKLYVVGVSGIESEVTLAPGAFIIGYDTAVTTLGAGSTAKMLLDTDGIDQFKFTATCGTTTTVTVEVNES